MKKILCLFGALTFGLTSCSSDEDSSGSPSSDLVLLKKTITTDSDGEKVTTIYKYDGNKIVSITDSEGEFNRYFTYTGDLITKIEYKLPDGTVDQINRYEYDLNNRLVTFVRVEPLDDWGNKEVYTYNTDGTITAQNYNGDSKSQTYFDGVTTIKFVNGEVSEIIPDGNWTGHHKYTYDTKQNPLKNVLGFDKLAFEDGGADGVNHNILTDKDVEENDLWENSTYTYNENGYPVKEVDKGSDVPGTTEFFY